MLNFLYDQYLPPIGGHKYNFFLIPDVISNDPVSLIIELPYILKGLKGILLNFIEPELLAPANTDEMTIPRANREPINILIPNPTLGKGLIPEGINKNEPVMGLANQTALGNKAKHTINLGSDSENASSLITPTVSPSLKTLITWGCYWLERLYIFITCRLELKGF